MHYIHETIKRLFPCGILRSSFFFKKKEKSLIPQIFVSVIQWTSFNNWLSINFLITNLFVYKFINDVPIYKIKNINLRTNNIYIPPKML